ncbi:hypothetical protein SteCoe_5575 [Stentor coeruleus]|uniref:Ribosomal RNA-processing protein 7 C-terminal domain-containing protein n=1 Tax=Stentor coeruleus TaxID=5963 RepID=A0A1R2CS17_9CILI|nr:hypothetical protein SteCoe_5575 [Stentor coeruleus]
MDSYLPLFISAKIPYNIYYRTHPNKSPLSIFVCCMDKPLKKNRVKKWFQHCGKIKSVEMGEMEKNSKTISYAIVEFKHKQALRRSLDCTWLQEQLEKTISQVKSVAIDLHVEEHVNKMEEDGFTMVLPKSSKTNKYDFIPPPAEYAENKETKTKDFYNFQVKREKSFKKMRSE